MRGLWFLLLFAALVGACAAVAAAEGENCTVAVVIAPDSRVAQITDTHASSVDFAGAFVVTGNVTAGGSVWLSAVTDLGWPAPVDPPSLAIGKANGGRGNFTLHVFVPAGVQADAVAHVTVLVTATVNGDGCLQDELVASVQPQAYWSATNVRSNRPLVELQPGEHTVPVTITLNRTTNLGEDTPVLLRVMAPAGIRHDGPAQVMLQDDGQGLETGTIVVNFTIDDLPPGTYTIRISSNPRGNSTATPSGGVVVFMSSIFIRIPDNSPGIVNIVLIAWAAVASVGAAALLWRKGRPGVPP